VDAIVNDHVGSTNSTAHDHAGDGPVPGPAISVDREHPGEEASLSDLLSRLVDDITLLFRQEVELAKTELRRDLTSAGKASGMLAAGAFLAFIATLLLAWAAAWGLATVVPTGVAFLIVALVVGAAAAAAIVTGRKRLQSIDVTPHETIGSIKRDKQVLSERTPR
jgi:hypothetical protein